MAEIPYSTTKGGGSGSQEPKLLPIFFQMRDDGK